MRLASVSVDLDEIHHYFEIHGVTPRGGAGTLVYDVAIDRLRGLADAGGFPLTLFAIGRDLERSASRDRLRAAALDGHEIANHSLDHRYDLVRLGKEEIRRQVVHGAAAIEAACGKRPVGFRAPGYTVSDEVFEVLAEEDVAYDASVFPCPAYWTAKTAAIGLIALRGRRSRSIVDTPNVLRAPTRPYRTGTPYWRRGGGVLEIPVQVTRGLRLPFIGTSVTLAGPTRARWLAKMCVGEPLVNLELHGIDVLDAADGLEELLPHQPDVRVAQARKVDAILAACAELAAAGYTFVTMREAAATFA
ncbi:MAG: polysaccharide deacetylase family protein [Labilithrix sp.]|nr:polysaccharide deacetylase family protein [Labilithrix sp.]MCW5814071.1 polysaccharide deacetylase family protein [Labilithrix sp.]